MIRKSIFTFGFIVAVTPALAFAQGATAPAGAGPAPLGAPQGAGQPPPTSPPPAGTVNATAPPAAYAPAPTTLAPPFAVGPLPATRGFSAWGILAGYGGAGYGVGARAMFALNGIKPLLSPTTNIRDGFSLEFGADYLHYSFGYAGLSDYGVSEFLPVGGIMWNLWFSDQFALYPKFEVGWIIAKVTGYPDGITSPTYGGFFWNGAGGAIYKLTNGISLRAEVGVQGLALGGGFLY